MNKIHKMGILTAAGLAILPLVGCGQQDVDGLARIGEKIAVRARAVKADVVDTLPADAVSVQARVRHRLRWDKQLQESSIKVAVDGAQVQLDGRVSSEAQKQRALEIAQSTLGVEKVENKLNVGPPATSSTPEREAPKTKTPEAKLP